ncbi:NAD(P)H-binding protein [Streptomyces mirabilis]
MVRPAFAPPCSTVAGASLAQTVQTRRAGVSVPVEHHMSTNEDIAAMKVFQIGASAGVGLRLAGLLAERGDEVTGMYRTPAKAETVRAVGAIPVAGDLVSDSVEELARKMAGHESVVFSAGAHGTGLANTTAIDGQGLRNAAEAAALAGVRRFVLVSVFPEAGRARERTEGFEHYLKVKKAADAFLTCTDLHWFIVRPGTLLDTPGTGHVAAGQAIEYGTVPRDDVAAFLAATLHAPELDRDIVELTSGDTPVPQAVAGLATRIGRRSDH